MPAKIYHESAAPKFSNNSCWSWNEYLMLIQMLPVPKWLDQIQVTLSATKDLHLAKLNGTTFWVPHVVLNPVPAQHNLLIFFSRECMFTKSRSRCHWFRRKNHQEGSFERLNVENIKLNESALFFRLWKTANTNKIGCQLTWGFWWVQYVHHVTAK